MDRRGILSFLAITFGITYAIELALIAAGFRITTDSAPMLVGQYVILIVMWVPALATFLTTRFVTHEGMGGTMLRFGSWKPYVGVVILMPLLFALTYGLSWALGVGRPDWQLTWLYDLVRSVGTDMSTAPAPATVLAALFVGSLSAGMLFNSFFAFGEEIGWRGYLLPKLLPLGLPKAHLVSGVIWGLWHAPLVLVGFKYTGYPVLGVIAMCCFTTSLGITINVLTLRYRSAVLAGWIHGVFNAQVYGIWGILSPKMNPLIGGISGVIGITVLLVAGIVVSRLWPPGDQPPADV